MAENRDTFAQVYSHSHIALSSLSLSLSNIEADLQPGGEVSVSLSSNLFPGVKILEDPLESAELDRSRVAQVYDSLRLLLALAGLDAALDGS